MSHERHEHHDQVAHRVWLLRSRVVVGSPVTGVRPGAVDPYPHGAGPSTGIAPEIPGRTGKETSMPDLSLRYNPTGEAKVTLVDSDSGEQISEFPWMVVVVPRDADLLVQLRTTDETVGEEVVTLPLTDTVGAREQAVKALQAKVVESGFEVVALRLGDEQEEPLP